MAGSQPDSSVSGSGDATPGGVAGVVAVAGGDGFVEAAAGRLRAAQAAMTELLHEAGLAGAKPTLIGRRLGVDKTLAWKIARFVEDPELVGAARHMPGSAGVEIVLKAASAHGVGEPRVRAVREADERLREFVRRHAGDRRSFEAMLAKGGRDDKIEFEERKALYKSGSAIWGVRARVQMLMLALRPSQRTEGMIDVLQLSGMFDFERLREDMPWIIRRLTNTTDGGSQETAFVREPLDPSGSPGGGLALVPRFCSEPMPEINQFRASDGTVYDELAAGPVGRHGAVSFVAGEIYRAAIPLAWSEGNREGRYPLTIRTPVESVLFDLLLHEDLRHFGDAEMSVHGLLEDRPGAGLSHNAPLYPAEPAQRLGSGPVLQTVRVGGYAEMVREAFGMASWGELGSYRGYRADVEFPPAPSYVVLRCPART